MGADPRFSHVRQRDEAGWTARKNPVTGEVFFLDSFYRTNQELG
jgi:hypothetical protein